MDKISGTKVRPWWFNPRTGSATEVGEFPNSGERQFLSPDPGELVDRVLVLDEAAKHFPSPGLKAQ
ncbi:MAG TPA: putative collagen-binding domain-containing protein [Gemmataceae bacterium]|nr:putative collagen-binding domain-containing protein [Gemmataceae bacterium]